MRRIRWVLALVVLALQAGPVQAEDGYDLWLRYRPAAPARQADLRSHGQSVVLPMHASATLHAAAAELDRALQGMARRGLRIAPTVTDGAILLGTSAQSTAIRSIHANLGALGTDGYLMRSTTIDGRRVLVVTGNSDIGVLYGTFALIAHMQRGLPLDHLALARPQAQAPLARPLGQSRS